VVGLVALGALLGTGLLVGSAAADPQQYSAAVGVGAPVLDGVMNALGGFANGVEHAAINSGTSSGSKHIVSFDANLAAGTSDTCITTKLNGPTFTRPSGTAGGLHALWAASGLSASGWDGTAIGAATPCTTGADIGGQIDFARSVDGPATGDTGTDLTYIPFGREAASFAYYRPAGTPVSQLSPADLTALFTTGPAVINGVTIVPCGIAIDTGTYSFWNRITGASSGQEEAATSMCNALLGRAGENDAAALKARGDALVALAGHSGDEVIIGYSTSAYIAQSNGVSLGTPPVSVGLGAVLGLGSATTRFGGIRIPIDDFYADPTFGRDVYVVLPTSVVVGAGNRALKALFVGAGAAICAASTQTTINTFGFVSSAACGTTTLRGSWLTGSS
jgi:hypothetical protein